MTITATKTKVTAEELTKELVQEKLLTNDTWLTRSLIILYERQTADEKRTENTKHDNNRGFNKGDGKALSNIARQVIYKTTYLKVELKDALTPNQKYLVRARIMKYANQIIDIANGRR